MSSVIIFLLAQTKYFHYARQNPARSFCHIHKKWMQTLNTRYYNIFLNNNTGILLDTEWALHRSGRKSWLGLDKQSEGVGICLLFQFFSIILNSVSSKFESFLRVLLLNGEFSAAASQIWFNTYGISFPFIRKPILFINGKNMWQKHLLSS